SASRRRVGLGWQVDANATSSSPASMRRVMPYVLPKLVRKFQEHYPAVTLEIVEDPPLRRRNNVTGESPLKGKLDGATILSPSFLIKYDMGPNGVETANVRIGPFFAGSRDF